MIDVSKAYSNILYKRLLNNLQKRKIDSKMVEWITLFPIDCYTIIKINKHNTPKLSLNLGLPQKSSLSSILYLFYNRDILNNCAIKRVDAQGYKDDITLIAISRSVKSNCQKLAKIYNKVIKPEKSNIDQNLAWLSTSSFI